MKTRYALLGLLMTFVVAVSANAEGVREETSGSSAQGEEAPVLRDARGVKVDVSNASRIASVGGLITETLYALGVGDRVVAVDSSSLHPEGVQDEHPVVGYIRDLSAEGVISTEPNLVLTSPDVGPPDVLTQIEEAGIAVFVVPTGDSVAAAKDAISTIGRIVSRENRAQSINDQIDEEVAQAREYVNAVTAGGEAEQRSAAFVYARGAGTLMVSGTDTSAHAMINLAGAENAVDGYGGYKPLTPEAMVASAPEVLIFTTRGLASIGGVEGARELPGVNQTPAGTAGRIIAMDDLYLLGFGPRLGNAVLDLSSKIYPEGEGL